nr:[protein-PII] uridylyltransferase [Marinifaba aquimaris]
MVNDYHQWLRDTFDEQPASKIVMGRAFYIDSLIRHLWRLYKLDQVKDLSLIAVGGYGRGHLNFHSDIDLLVLSKSSLKDEAKSNLSLFITLLWDIGLDIGSSVRTLKEANSLGKQDITIATNMLESRLITGCSKVFEKLTKAISHRSFWPSDKFFTAKYDEQKQRHEKFNGTSYNLEPNIKENPGGLRDIQMIGWIAKKHFKVADGNELVQEDFLLPEELLELQDCRKFLWRMRCALQMVANRSENRLLFEYQPDVAKMLGYGQGKASVEKMMKEYFIMARRITELNEMLLQYFVEEILGSFNQRKSEQIDDDFDLYNGLLRINTTNAFDKPENILMMFLTVANTPDIKGLHSVTIRQLRIARRFFEREEELCHIPECRQVFLQLIKHPEFFGQAWDMMHKYGIMAIYSHDWEHIVGLMQFDLFHAYTVDEHTHRLVKNIYRYTQPHYNHEFPRCSKICDEYPKMELLYLAAIFHDICKGRGGDHSELGAMAVRDFMNLHSFSGVDTELVSWLVESHLLISTVAQRKDIHDPEVIDEFVDTVQDESRLSLLYALTLADIRATNASLYNQWKASLMRDLFLNTQKVLRSGKSKGPSLPARIEQRQNDTLSDLMSSGFDKEAIYQLWQGFDNEYFVRYTPKQISWHCEHILNAEDDEPLILIDNQIHRGATTVFVYCADKPFLFSTIATLLDRKNFNVHSAEILSTTQGKAIDSFFILDNDDTLLTEQRFKDARDAVLEALDKGAPKDTFAGRIPRQIKQFHVPTKVYWLHNNDTSRTYMELEALDTPGLLSKIGRVFLDNKITIHTAKVSTIGERAEDFFIVSNQEGLALTETEKHSLSEQLKKELTL